MLRLEDIMTRELVTLSPEHSLREAMSILTSRHISGAPVLSNGTVVGVASLTDLAEFAASSPGVPTERPGNGEWDEWDSPAEIPEGEEPSSAWFQQLWDDSGAEVGERMGETGGPEWNALEEHTVVEVMSRRIQSLSGGTSVEEAASFMRDHSIHRVLVVDEGTLSGVVTTKDISDAVADHRIGTRTVPATR